MAAAAAADFLAITRAVCSTIERCELTYLSRVAIDLEAARLQHAAYEECLREAGCRVLRLPSDGDLPDSVFVEDIAVVFDEVAIITRPGAESRRLETAAVEQALGPYRPLRRIESPGTADGGDVLVVGRSVFVGCSSRTNAAGIEQMRRHLAQHDYTVHAIAVHGCLHLKSAVTALADDLLLINPQWMSAEVFGSFEVVEVHPDEPSGANALRIDDHLVYPAAFPRTRERLEARGLAVATVDVSELAKAEGAATCCSLIVKV